MARYTGWIAVALIVMAACLPLVYRAKSGRRAPPQAPTVRWHVLLGLGTAFFAFSHTVLAVPVLGSPGAIAGGVVPLASAGAAFFLLVAHSGLGLQLRDIKLRDRASKRRAHTLTAIAIAIAVAIHVVALLTGE
jgi:hypothetical protein